MPNRRMHFIQSDLLFFLLLFFSVSLIAIYNAQQLAQYGGENFVLKQAVWFGAGILIAAAIQLLDMEQLYKISMYIYMLGVLGLVVLYVSPESIAKEINGAKSWFTFSGLSLQPSEFTKISLIVFLAAMISKHTNKYTHSSFKTDLFLLVKVAFVTAIPVGLIFLEPDFGTSMVVLFIAGVLVVLSGIDWKMLAVIIISILLLAVGTITLFTKFPAMAEGVTGLKTYQVNRILTWMDPTQQSSNDTFQIDRSMLSVGSGQLTGKGMSSLQVILPEAHTDFIFSVIGESFGFFGSAAVILLYFLLLHKLVTLGLRTSRHNRFGAFICFGYMSLMLIHTFQNIGMSIGIMPITGIPLLLISYGGSSVLASVIGFGLVYRVAVDADMQKEYLFR